MSIFNKIIDCRDFSKNDMEVAILSAENPEEAEALEKLLTECMNAYDDALDIIEWKEMHEEWAKIAKNFLLKAQECEVRAGTKIEYCDATFAIDYLDEGIQSQEDPDTVMVEYMPEHLANSHENCKNWGIYPFNGAVREKMTRQMAEDLIENDPYGYALMELAGCTNNRKILFLLKSDD